MQPRLIMLGWARCYPRAALRIRCGSDAACQKIAARFIKPTEGTDLRFGS